MTCLSEVSPLSSSIRFAAANRNNLSIAGGVRSVGFRIKPGRTHGKWSRCVPCQRFRA